VIVNWRPQRAARPRRQASGQVAGGGQNPIDVLAPVTASGDWDRSKPTLWTTALRKYRSFADDWPNSAKTTPCCRSWSVPVRKDCDMDEDMLLVAAIGVDANGDKQLPAWRRRPIGGP